MNRLTNAERAQIVAALVEGNSLRSVSRMTGVSINTVTKLLVDLGSREKSGLGSNGVCIRRSLRVVDQNDFGHAIGGHFQHPQRKVAHV